MTQKLNEKIVKMQIIYLSILFKKKKRLILLAYRLPARKTSVDRKTSLSVCVLESWTLCEEHLQPPHLTPSQGSQAASEFPMAARSPVPCGAGALFARQIWTLLLGVAGPW